VARMLQMNTSSGETVDPHFVALVEAGREARCYCITTTCAVMLQAYNNVLRGMAAIDLGVCCELRKAEITISQCGGPHGIKITIVRSTTL
jgi:hypothetical protein